LNQSTTVWPAKALVSKLTLVQLPELEQTFGTVARVAPEALRICAWIWS
jgi:hypothetical protein